jgi:hypothetical protein
MWLQRTVWIQGHNDFLLAPARGIRRRTAHAKFVSVTERRSSTARHLAPAQSPTTILAARLVCSNSLARESLFDGRHNRAIN